MEINKEIRAFASFLNASWDIIVPLLSGREYTSDESSIGDWLQANWEILVEKKILKQNEYLEIYSEGVPQRKFKQINVKMSKIERDATKIVKLPCQ